MLKLIWGGAILAKLLEFGVAATWSWWAVLAPGLIIIPILILAAIVKLVEK